MVHHWQLESASITSGWKLRWMVIRFKNSRKKKAADPNTI
jgi:hypothetical protein